MTVSSPVLSVQPLGFPWATSDPFLFCAYHDDAYPRGNGRMGPAESLAGRDIGQDFSRKDGWSMYHGDSVPGFPAHPHRGFETVTIVRKGLIDHSDSLGATARFGGGDVQWVTAGRGIVHSEMFPLLETGQDNPLELFQIWLNLPQRSKMAQPHFTMLWNEQVPRRVFTDGEGRRTEVAVIAGRCGEVAPLAPPPDSWAAQADADVAIWTVRMEPGATWTLPAATGAGTQRTLYFFKGQAAQVAGEAVAGPVAIQLRADAEVPLVAGDGACEFLLLQGRPIAEPVAQYGPFVMNTAQEIQQALQDYRRTQFGGWSFGDAAPVHGSEPKRFAKYPDGRVEEPA
ncbi:MULTISPECIES: pirin family protein [Ramlibacter]|uniref:Pirin family protein n=1 Tax=Ramlibacter pinisoli TaxID=2682844 RepID=A0A6N8ISI5_9BURK|nr:MULTISPECIES: pirin family protein [Ramlibacter]MBA2964727.1 pirin family protein [Ramlibacter sp. CGMCC 1.13660]MVQ29692.1 pirin family protein [Ramlibacter pinisoli]